MSSDVREILKGRGIFPKKSLGQNFCSDSRLVSDVSVRLSNPPDSEIWELGPGLGSLTKELVSRCARLRIFEIDQRFKPILQGLAQEHPHLEIFWGDFFDADLKGLNPGKNLYICGNLPYYCGTAMMRHALTLNPPPCRMVFLLQKELVEKVCAKPGDDEYGFLSVAIQLFAEAKIGDVFSPVSFYPPPEVESAIVEVVPFSLSDEESAARRKAQGVASKAFEQRRKMALNVLKRAFPEGRPAWNERFSALGISHQARAETISSEQFLALARPIC